MTSAPPATVTEKNCESDTTTYLVERSREPHGNVSRLFPGGTVRLDGLGISNCDTEAPGEDLSQTPLPVRAPAPTAGFEEPPLTVAFQSTAVVFIDDAASGPQYIAVRLSPVASPAYALSTVAAVGCRRSSQVYH